MRNVQRAAPHEAEGFRLGPRLVDQRDALLFLTHSASAYADSAVTYAVGVVVVEKDGTVGVCVTEPGNSKCEGGEILFPSNGKGLFQSGQIEEDDIVDLKIVYDRGKFRGHVTVLK